MPHLVVVLHDIRSDHNVGSMFRTADGAGFSKIFLCGITPGPKDRFGRDNTKLKKVSLGTEDTLSWEHVVSTARLLGRLKREGYYLVGVEQAERSLAYDKLAQTLKRARATKIALVMGTELKGLPKSLLSRVDAIAEIPMRGQKESLNVSVAFGIVAFALSGSFADLAPTRKKV